MIPLSQIIQNAAIDAGANPTTILASYKRQPLDIPSVESWRALTSPTYVSDTKKAELHLQTLPHRFHIVADEGGAISAFLLLTRAYLEGNISPKIFEKIMYQPVVYFWHHDCTGDPLIEQEVLAIPEEHKEIAVAFCRYAAEKMPAPHPLINLNTIFSSLDYYEIPYPVWQDHIIEGVVTGRIRYTESCLAPLTKEKGFFTPTVPLFVPVIVAYAQSQKRRIHFPEALHDAMDDTTKMVTTFLNKHPIYFMNYGADTHA